MKFRIASAFAVSLMTASFVCVVHAQTWPDRPITMVVPGPAGAGTDVPARMLAPLLAQRLKQNIVVDNRPVASGTLGMTQVLGAKPDGYTMLFGNGTVLGIAPSLFASLSVEQVARFAPVGLVGFAPMMLVVSPALQANSVKALVDLAQAQPGKLNLAHAGNGTPHHLTGELFKQTTRVDMVSVPFKGAVAALTALAGSQVDAHFEGPSGVPLIKAGKIRVLAVAGSRRHSALPDTPTFAEVGYPDVVVSAWYGITAPPGTPAAIVSRLNVELNALLESDELKSSFGRIGLDIEPGPPEAFGRFMLEDLQRMARVVKAANLKMD